jgi:hypothetical protein
MKHFRFDIFDQDGFWGTVQCRGRTQEEAKQKAREMLSDSLPMILELIGESHDEKPRVPDEIYLVRSETEEG